MSLLDWVPKKNPEWEPAEGVANCVECNMETDQLLYNNETGKLRVRCDDGHVSEIYIGAGRSDNE